MPEDDLSSGDREPLNWVEKAFTRAAIDEIYSAFIDADYAPSATVLEAMSSIVRSSHNEQRRYIALLAKRRGGTSLADHLRPTD